MVILVLPENVDLGMEISEWEFAEVEIMPVVNLC